MIFALATMDDAARLYAWRIDPLVESNSLTAGPRTFEEHCDWLRRALTNDRMIIWIARDPERSATVGTLRLLLRADDKTVDVSVTVDGLQRGRGYAAEMIGAVVTSVVTRKPPMWEKAATLRALVKERNVASLRAFWAHGFRGERAEDGVITLERTWC